MDVRDYCSSLEAELVGWKAKVYDVVRKFDKMPSGDKEKAVPFINELHMIIEDLSDRIDTIQKECPTEWGPDKTAWEAKVVELKSKWEKMRSTVKHAVEW